MADSEQRLVAPGTFIGHMGAAWYVWRQHVRAILLPFVIGAFLYFTLLQAGLILLGDEELSETTQAGASILLVFALTLVGGLVSATGIVARSIVVMADGSSGRTTTMTTAGARLRPVKSHVIAAGMISLLLSGGVAVLLIYNLGPFVAPYLFLGPPVLAPVIALEGKTLPEGWRRTRRLLSGNALRLFLYLLCAALLLSLTQLILGQTLLSALSSLGTGFALVLVATAAWSTLLGLAFSLMVAVTLIAYFDLRSRKENFALEDLQEPPGSADD